MCVQVLCQCDIAKFLLELLALDRGSYKVRAAFSARIVERVAKIGNIGVVYGFEDLTCQCGEYKKAYETERRYIQS